MKIILQEIKVDLKKVHKMYASFHFLFNFHPLFLQHQHIKEVIPLFIHDTSKTVTMQ